MVPVNLFLLVIQSESTPCKAKSTGFGCSPEAVTVWGDLRKSFTRKCLAPLIDARSLVMLNECLTIENEFANRKLFSSQPIGVNDDDVCGFLASMVEEVVL